MTMVAESIDQGTSFVIALVILAFIAFIFTPPKVWAGSQRVNKFPPLPGPKHGIFTAVGGCVVGLVIWGFEAFRQLDYDLLIISVGLLVISALFGNLDRLRKKGLLTRPSTGEDHAIFHRIPFNELPRLAQEGTLDEFFDDITLLEPIECVGHPLDIVVDLRDAGRANMARYVSAWGNPEEQLVLDALEGIGEFATAWRLLVESKATAEEHALLRDIDSLDESYKHLSTLFNEAGGEQERHVQHLLQHGIIDPVIPAPHFTPVGIALRSIFLKTHPDVNEKLMD